MGWFINVILHKMDIFKKLLLLSFCCIGAGFHLLAQEQISFTWGAGTVPKSFLLRATAGKSFTVNWGDSSSSTETGLGGSANTLTHSYMSTGTYIVTITGSTDCLFTLLDIQNAQVTVLDVSNVPSLTDIQCHDNALTNLNLNANGALNRLYCYNNALTNLDVTNNSNLEHLDCHNNRLTTLNVTQNAELLQLSCHKNQLTTLDVSQNLKLAYLLCYSNNLSILDIRNNVQLNYLMCEDNQLSTLDITANLSLTAIYCGNNKLSLSHLYAISSLKPYQYLGKQYLDVVQAYENVEVDLTDSPTIGGTPTVFAVTKGGLPAPSGDYTINTVTGKITFHTMGTYTVKKTNTAIKSHTTQPAEVYRTYAVAGTQSIIFTWKGATSKSFTIRAPAGEPFTVDWGDGGALSSYIGSGATDITPTHSYTTTNNYTVTINGSDSACRFTLLNLNNKQVSNLSVIEGIDLTELQCKNNTLSALDLTYNTALEYLDCHTNLLTTFNVSHNTALKYIDCSNNPLYSIDVLANTQLTNLQCTNNSLSTLDVSANILLITLNCSANALTMLDVSQNTQLTSLESNNNQLSSLDISNNTSLKSLNCAYNRLPELDITANPLQHVFCHSNSIPLGNLYDIATAIGNQNETQLGMQQLDTLRLFKGIGVTVDAVLNGVNTNFTVTMAGIGPVSDGVEYTVNYATQKLTFNTPGTYTVKMTNAAIIDNPTPVQASVYRTYDVDDSQTITFDWTGGAGKSFIIRATGGQTFTVAWGDATVDTLTGAGSVDITSTHTYADNNSYTVTVIAGGACSLTLLNVSNQQVTSINITDAPALATLNCANNQLTTLNVSQNPLLNLLECNQNPLTGLNVTANPNLLTLHCSQTGLTALDVTQNTQLTALHCSSNALTALNVSLNTQLRTLDCKANLLTSLTLANNTQLIWLYCDDNRLTALNINTNTALEVLTCENNNLIALNIDYNLQLNTLYCSGNRLTALNIANNVLLVVLHCDNNAIPALNIINNSVLSVLHCHNNAIPLANLYTLSNAISNVVTKWLGTQRLDTVTISTGMATSVDAVLGGVNTVFTVNNGTAVEGVDYTIDYTTRTITFNSPGIYTVKMTNTAITSETNYPAVVWRTYNAIGLSSITFVWQGGTGKSFKITAPVGEQFTVDWGDGRIDSLTGNGLGMASALTPTHNYANTNNDTVTVATNSTACQFAYLSLAGKQLLSLNVTNAIGLSQLDCSMNPALGTLNVTRNTDLVILDCITTSLTSLNLTNNPKLARLNCSKNALTALDISNNPLLYYLNCEENTTLFTIDVSANTQLRELSCGHTSLTTLNVTANSQLQKLDCKDNLLTTLNLSGNAQLTTVNVDNNHLPALDITGNPALTSIACHNNHIPLANLYTLSNAVTTQNNKNLGTQRLDTLAVMQGVANSVDAVLGGVNTIFTVNGGAATDGVEYTVNYTTQTITFNANGAFTVKMTNTAITSNTSYPAEVWRTYHVGSYDITHANITPIPSQTYTGYAIQPLPTVTMGLDVLVKDTNYTVSYTGNINVGPATITITGVGNYYGTNQTVFTITPMTVTVAELTVQTKIYDGTTGATLLFDIAAFKRKLSPADTAAITVNPPTTGTFAQANEGTNIPVTAAGNVTLGGAKAGNYTIIQQTGLTGTIVNNNTDATITITNTTYNPVDNTYTIECGKTTATVQVNTVNPAALVIHNGTILPSKQFHIDASTPGSWTETFTVSTPDSTIQQTYTITLVKWFTIDLTDDACIIKEKWNNTLLINNNPASNGNYHFTTYAWFKDNILIGNDQSYSAGNAPTDRLDPNAYYYATMDTRDGQSLRTCPFHPLMIPLPAPAAPLTLSIYPNPASAGQPVQVNTNIPPDQLTNATIDIYNITGRRITSQRMTSAITTINMPVETGLYIVKVKTMTTETTITIIVN